MDVLDWLLDSDPAVRWQVLRDLAVASPEEVAAERKRVATHGWGARLLALQEAGGQWDGGTYWPHHDDDPEGQPWTATTYTLLLLREFGLDPESQEARHAISLVKDNSRWEEGGQPFFEGEVEPCINGMTVALGAYFGRTWTPSWIGSPVGSWPTAAGTAMWSGAPHVRPSTPLSASLRACWSTNGRLAEQAVPGKHGAGARNTCSSVPC